MFLISSADVFDNSGMTPFQVLGTVPDLPPPACTVNCETTNNTDLANCVTDNIEANTTAAMTCANNFISNPLVANNIDTIPLLNAGASGEPALPNARHETNGAVGVAHPPALPLSQDPSTVASTSGQDPGGLTAPAAPKMADNDGIDLSTCMSTTKGPQGKRYLQSQKIVPGVMITVRFKVHSSYQSCATNSSYRNFRTID
jgi:hypothetical protein